jgi:hypothetical protein
MLGWRYLTVKANQKPSVNDNSSAEYVESTCIAPVAKIRAAMDLEKEEDSVLMMDTCPSHITDQVMDAWTAAGLDLAPSHRTSQNAHFQLLDLTLFKIFKREGKDYLPFGNLITTVSFVSHSCEPTASSRCIPLKTSSILTEYSSGGQGMNFGGVRNDGDRTAGDSETTGGGRTRGAFHGSLPDKFLCS